MMNSQNTADIKSISKLQDILNILEYIKKKYPYSNELQEVVNLVNISNLSNLVNIPDEKLEKLHENIIIFSIKNIGREIQHYYDLQEKLLSDIKQIFDEFNNGYKTFSQNKILAAETVKIRDLSEKIIENIDDLQINVPSKDLLIMVNNAQFFKPTDIINDQKNVDSLKWFEESLLKNLNNSTKWYGFLDNLYTSLSEYDIQKNINRFTDIAVELKDQIDINQDIPSEIIKSLKKFLATIITKNSKSEYINIEDIEDIKLDKLKLKSLKRLLESTLLYETNVLCDSNLKTRRVELNGPYIKLSDITNRNYVNFSNTTKKECNFEPKSIEIFTLNKVFIDDDFNKTANLEQLSIVAPTWDILGPRKITLDGEPGKAHDEPKALSGKGIGFDGEHGKPGYPGSSAGHFVGIGEFFVNGPLLTISAIGGEGGSGQNGGDGALGRDGYTQEEPGDKYSCATNLCETHDNCIRHYESFVSELIPGHFWNTLLGTPGHKGGNGGNGGRGGQGGKLGEVFLNTLNNYYGTSKYYSNGITGKNGTAGVGGLGGVNGDDLTVDCGVFGPEVWKVTNRKINGRSSPGSNGIDGGNYETIKNSITIPFQRPSYIINKFKHFVRENLSNSLRESYLRKFINLVETQQKVMESYDTLGFFDELLLLENQFYKLNSKLYFLPFYDSLLRRINEYSVKNIEKISEEEKKVVSYLFAATLSKICTYNNNLAGGMVVNVPEYLDIVLKRIETLQKAKTELLLDTYRNDYEETIDEKIKEAVLFIETPIEQAINKNIDDIDENIATLINDTIGRENVTMAEREILMQKKSQLGPQIILRSFLSTIKIAGQLLSFAGPMGAAANTVIGGAVLMAETSLSDDPNGPPIDKIMPEMRGSLSRIEDHIKYKQQFFKKQLYDANKHLEDELLQNKDLSNYNIETVSNSIKEINDNLNKKIDNNEPLESVDELYNMQKKLKELLQVQKDLLEQEKPKADIKSDDRIRLVSYVQNIMKIPEMGIQEYTKIRNEMAKLNQLDESIEQVNEKINELVQHEKDIYNILIPAFKNLKNDINTVKQSLQNKSHVALDVSKWQIQSTIRDVKYQMQKMSEGYSVQGNLKYLVDKLDDSMSTMIDVYNRIEDYREKADLAVYIKQINSNKNTLQNKTLNDAIDKLNVIVQSNLVLEKYELAMNSFKQYIFPLANYFLAEFTLPSYLKSTDTDSLTERAKTKISGIQLKIKESRAVTNNLINFIHKRIAFRSITNKKTKPPFFVWKHDTNKQMISRLLEGEEITIKADIHEGLEDNAVKFNEIWINFKLENKTAQNELDGHLKNFKVVMTHLGNSYYRCDNKFYIITSARQTLIYSLDKNKNGEPSEPHFGIYEMLRNNEPILSPYTMWKIKLNNTNDNFDALAQYKDQEIDLELEGHGLYMDRVPQICDNVDKYYTLDDTISDINSNGMYELESLDRSNKNIRVDNKTYNYEEKTHHRRRRSVNKQDLSQNIEGSSFATSGISKNVESSFISNIANIILNPIKLISEKLKVNKSNIDRHELDTLNNNPNMDVKSENMKPIFTKSPESSVAAYGLTNNQTFSTLNNLVNDSLLFNQSNLLLLDLLIRRKNGVKYNNKMKLSNDRNLTHAQTLAYRESMPFPLK